MLISKSTYQKPRFLSGQHLETVIPSLFRKVSLTPTHKERISTLDNDFLDLDWHTVGSDTVCIISHGLEGSSQSQYVTGMARYLNAQHIDALAWNYRGCSGEINLTATFYHSGATYDLETVVNHTLQKGYSKIILIGFSLGGNLTLKYLGEPSKKHMQIKCAITFSTPLDLSSGCDEISKPKNILYANRFLRRLKKKLIAKNKIMGTKFPLNGVSSIKDLKTFDNIYTGPLHGFKDAEDYYAKSSAIFYLENISTPALIINAKNDPFLSDTCYPYQILKHHSSIWFETPNHGGHVGFMSFAKDGSYWSERRAYEFIKENL